jgi:hypothetical protein
MLTKDASIAAGNFERAGSAIAAHASQYNCHAGVSKCLRHAAEERIRRRPHKVLERTIAQLN